MFFFTSNIKKDGKYKKTNSLDFIRDVFNIADLSDEHKLVLKYLYLLKNRQNLTIQKYRDLTGQINLNILNDLQYRNWISYVKTVNGIEIKVHQLVYDLIENDWRPHATSCREFLDHITKNLKITDQYATEMRANWRHKKHIEQAVNRKAATSVVQVLSLLDYTDANDVDYVVDFFYFELIDFPIFNVADIYVTVSAFALAFLIMFYYKEDEFEEIFHSRNR